MHAGHNADVVTHEQYIPVNAILAEVGHDFACCLHAALAITGFDKTSGFFKIGKHSAFTKLQHHVKNKPEVLQNIW